MIATLSPEAPSNFSRSLIVRPPSTSGASPRTMNRYAHAMPMPVGRWARADVVRVAGTVWVRSRTHR